MKKALILIVLLVGHVSAAFAHTASSSFLYWNGDADEPVLRLDLFPRDLHRELDLDADGNGRLSWGEIEDREKAISDYLQQQLTLYSRGQSCPFGTRLIGTSRHSDGRYLVYKVSPRCPEGGDELSLDYRLFFETDKLHRALVKTRNGGTPRLHVLSPEASRLNLADASGLWHTARLFFVQGAVHMWRGYDHMLFLLALLLPLAVQRQRNKMEVGETIKPALLRLIGIVTSFTLAHSLTLSLAALGWVSLPSKPVEIAIALSVAAAAVNMVWPLPQRGLYAISFGFGLVHGFGFAGVLAEFITRSSSQLAALAAFNLGVEAAQLAVIGVLFPVLVALRHSDFYRNWVLPVSACSIFGVGVFWAISRAALT